MIIDGRTRLIGLVGNPVEHTLSPLIQNGISQRMGIPSVYVPFKVEEQGVAEAVRGAYALNILGMNVTVPFKNCVMEDLVEVDEAAGQIGAVNTLVRVEELGGYKGYNTDWMGLRRQIREDGIRLRGETVVVLGAGGASRAVVYMCLLEGAEKIYLLNRTISKAEQVAEDMNRMVRGKQISMQFSEKPESGISETGQKVVPMALSDYSKIPEEKLIAFQSTSIGLTPDSAQVVISDAAFYKKIKTGVDLIYNPSNTRFMQMVTEYGGKASNALKMLLYQGVVAYELWHTIKVPQDIIEDIYVDLKRKVYPRNNIVLIGFMGSGKTTVGSSLAKELGMNFIDTDDYIEKRFGKKISEIFAEDGEEAFRNMEREALLHLREFAKNTIFSTGGGMPLRKENARLLKEIGKVFYLTAASQVIYERVKDSMDRPLLQSENAYTTICRLMRERKPFYEAAADALIDTNSNNLENIKAQIKSIYQNTKGKEQ